MARATQASSCKRVIVDACIPVEVTNMSRRNRDITERRGGVTDEGPLDVKEIELPRFGSETRKQEKS